MHDTPSNLMHEHLTDGSLELVEGLFHDATEG